MSEPYVTRRELDLLKTDADAERSRMRESIRDLAERAGSVSALQVRMDGMVTSLADLKADMRTRFDEHHREHERDEARRVSSRRWMVGAIIAAVAAVDGPLVTILLARH